MSGWARTTDLRVSGQPVGSFDLPDGGTNELPVIALTRGDEVVLLLEGEPRQLAALGARLIMHAQLLSEGDMRRAAGHKDVLNKLIDVMIPEEQ